MDPTRRSAVGLGVALLAYGRARAGDAYASARQGMVANIRQLLAAGAAGDVRRLDPAVMQAMADTPRHLFVPPALRGQAYGDGALPIGHDATISQPLVVALMTHLAEPGPGEVVLEVGTGSGYQAAVLARLVRHVFSVELVPELAEAAARRLAALGVRNVAVRQGDGYAGWPEHAPFDAIVVTARAEKTPPALLRQLKPGGRLVIPVGPQGLQQLTVYAKDEAGRLRERRVMAVDFVPLRPAR